jgi:hypothetical protein
VLLRIFCALASAVERAANVECNSDESRDSVLTISWRFLRVFCFAGVMGALDGVMRDNWAMGLRYDAAKLYD